VSEISARTRIDRMIRGRTVARMGNQEVGLERERTVVCDRRLESLRIGRCGGGCATRNRRREFEDSAVDAGRQVGFPGRR